MKEDWYAQLDDPDVRFEELSDLEDYYSYFLEKRQQQLKGAKSEEPVFNRSCSIEFFQNRLLATKTKLNTLRERRGIAPK
jgi:hypothetical protein